MSRRGFHYNVLFDTIQNDIGAQITVEAYNGMDEQQRQAFRSGQLSQSKQWSSGLSVQPIGTTITYVPGIQTPWRAPVTTGIGTDFVNQSEKPNTKEKTGMFDYAKSYLDKHKDAVMTVSLVLFIDHFFLGGALRERVKSILEGMLDSAQKKLSHTPALEDKKNAA